MNIELNKIYHGDALEVLKTFPSDSIDCCITSPPYWGLRDYGTEGQLGLEPDFRDYITRLADIFDEVKRILKPEGTCWVNIGDTYFGGGGGSYGSGKEAAYTENRPRNFLNKLPYPAKSLAQIPSRFAIEMTDRGWILRNEIIWHKPNCMPASVKDRFTVDFEKLFFFTKSKKYYFEAQAETSFTDPNTKARGGFGSMIGKNNTPDRAKSNRPGKAWDYTGTRNKRAVWKIPTRPFAEAHFAVFPEDLVITPLRAGCPPFGTVLDPFMGAGTTGLVSQKLDRNYVGIELNPEYIEMANRRLAQKNLLMSAS